MRVLTKYFLSTTFAISLMACGSATPGANSTSQPTDTPAQISKHQKSDCPEFQGTFVNTDSSSDTKTVSTTSTALGVLLEDTGVNWTVDGESHPGDGADNLNYVAVCSRSVITIDLFQGATHLGIMTYTLDAAGNLVTSLEAIDSRVGPSNRSVWHR